VPPIGFTHMNEVIENIPFIFPKTDVRFPLFEAIVAF
jgi:hypothetical protein